MYSGLAITLCVTEDNFEVLILLPPTPKCWDYRCAVHWVYAGLGIKPKVLHILDKCSTI